MYQVEGYEFESKELAAQAQRELEGIRYIRAQTHMDDPQVVLRLYDKLILKEVFATPVGYQFLFELQEYLKASPQIKSEEIRLIPVFVGNGNGGNSDGDSKGTMKARKEAIRQARKLEEVEKQLVEARRLNRNERDYKKLFRGSMIFSLICVLIIVGIFAITGLSENNVNIINYKNELINEYESWEKDLQEREDAVSAKEAELGIVSGTEE